jgi:transcriptional regulator with XRE-family HTH domain/ketosteroid isomerase-like protein
MPCKCRDKDNAFSWMVFKYTLILFKIQTKMKQPELGKKVAELRKVRGFTQEELAEKCRINVRTIQRIECGEVMPRSFTVKLIFSALTYDIYNDIPFYLRLKKVGELLTNLSGQFYRYVLQLFNLKTNTMKKLTILSTPFIAVFLILLFTGSGTKAQDRDLLLQQFNESNNNFVRWFNAGQIDSLLTDYQEDACMIPDEYGIIKGKPKIREYYRQLYNRGLRFTSVKAESIVFSDSIIVERETWQIDLAPEVKITGSVLCQWRLNDGKWKIENEMTNTDPPVTADVSH